MMSIDRINDFVLAAVVFLQLHHQYHPLVMSVLPA